MNEPINNDTTIYVRFVRKDVNVFKPIKIDKIVYEQIQKIAYTTSSEAVYYFDDYTAFLNDKENSYSIIIFYEDNSTSFFI